MRAKVKHKVAEHTKKAKKAAKKDVTWKSSTFTLDPFIELYDYSTRAYTPFLSSQTNLKTSASQTVSLTKIKYWQRQQLRSKR